MYTILYNYFPVERHGRKMLRAVFLCKVNTINTGNLKIEYTATR